MFRVVWRVLLPIRQCSQSLGKLVWIRLKPPLCWGQERWRQELIYVGVNSAPPATPHPTPSVKQSFFSYSTVLVQSPLLLFHGPFQLSWANLFLYSSYRFSYYHYPYIMVLSLLQPSHLIILPTSVHNGKLVLRYLQTITHFLFIFYNFRVDSFFPHIFSDL